VTWPGTLVAIALEFIDIVVPIARIRESYPGGWAQCLLDYSPLLGRRIWYDRHLFRDGAMSASDVHLLVEGWAVLGLEPSGLRKRQRYWKDVCVVDWRHRGPHNPWGRGTSASGRIQSPGCVYHSKLSCL